MNFSKLMDDFLQESVPIQPKTREILPKFCQKLATDPVANASAADNRGRSRRPIGVAPVHLDAHGVPPAASPTLQREQCTEKIEKSNYFFGKKICPEKNTAKALTTSQSMKSSASL
jgi:hypothetical protein